MTNAHGERAAHGMSGLHGGAGNERGGVHRAGVAASLACYGLVGQSPLPPERGANGPVPMRLEYETGAATDDLRCAFTDGTVMDISAKRHCGNDEAFRKTVAQWKAQAATLRHGDRLALAVAEPTGPIRHLGAALRRRRAGAPVYPADEETALQILQGLLTDVPDKVTQRLLDAAHVLIIHAGEAADPDTDRAASRLENVIVPAGDGVRAFDALYKSMQVDASIAYVSDVEVWLNVIDTAKVTLYRDAKGPIGAVVRARQVAVAAHRRRLNATDGVVELALLAPEAGILRVPGLAGGLRVTVSGADHRPEKVALEHLARRWPRLLLVGLPGMGKSTAVRQLAARWAGTDDAPIPLIVPLLLVARRCATSDEVTLPLLCEIAARHAPAEDREVLTEAFEQACLTGRAAVFGDGLDECGARRGAVAQGVAALAATLPAQTSVVITTRAATLPATIKDTFAPAELIRPDNLDEILDQVLQHAAAPHTDPTRLPGWLRSRHEWLRRTRREHRDMGDVPLLATLLALAVAEQGDVPLPSSTAHLLAGAVRDSVRRWEQRRELPADAGQPAATSQQLLDGFAALGHLQATQDGPITSAQALAAVTAVLTTERWGYTAAPAEELAEQITEFWDHQVAVFVHTRDGVVARSRVFTEIAVAMRTRTLAAPTRAVWVTSALHDEQQHQALLLAAELEPAVLALLLDDAGPAAACLLAADAVVAGAQPTSEQLRVLLHALADASAAARDGSGTTPATVPASQPERDGPGWEHLNTLAGLPVPPDLRAVRDAWLTGAALDDERRTVLAARATLADADVDQRPLSADEIQKVQQMLQLPRPGPAVTVEVIDGIHDFVESAFLLTGHVTAAFAAARHLPLLDPAVIDDLQELGQWADWRDGLDLKRTLLDHGISPKPTGVEAGMAALAALVAPIEQAGRERPLLDAIAALAPEPAAVADPTRHWRYDDLAHLLAVAGADHVPAAAFGHAVATDTDNLRRGWFAGLATAAGLDHTDLAAQARRALAERTHEPRPGDLWDLLTCPMPQPFPRPDHTRLTEQDRDGLVAALHAESEWIADNAARTLLGVVDDGLSSTLQARLADHPPPRRYLVAQLACRTASDPTHTAAGMLGGDDVVQRVAAAIVLRDLDRSVPAVAALQTVAAGHADLTVRDAAGRAAPATAGEPTGWSCVRCAVTHDLRSPHCPGCNGKRPTPNQPE